MIYYLILGFLLATIGTTLINGLCDILAVLIEWIKVSISVKIVKHNQEINKIMEEQEEVHTRAIGFNADWGEEYYDYDDEEEDDY